MITSITTASVAATSALAGWGIALGAGGAILVIGLLVALELVGTGQTRFRSTLQAALRIAVSPLLVVFAVSVVARALATIAS